MPHAINDAAVSSTDLLQHRRRVTIDGEYHKEAHVPQHFRFARNGNGVQVSEHDDQIIPTVLQIDPFLNRAYGQCRLRRTVIVAAYLPR